MRKADEPLLLKSWCAADAAWSVRAAKDTLLPRMLVMLVQVVVNVLLLSTNVVFCTIILCASSINAGFNNVVCAVVAVLLLHVCCLWKNAVCCTILCVSSIMLYELSLLVISTAMAAMTKMIILNISVAIVGPVFVPFCYCSYWPWNK